MSLRKVNVVAVTEFKHLIRTKVFLLSLFLVPVFSLGLGYLPFYLGGRPDLKIRRLAVRDASGALFGALRTAAAAKAGARLELLEIPFVGGEGAGDPRPAVLERIRRGELFAYLEIPAHAVGPAKGPREALLYYSDTPTYEELPAWLEQVLNLEIRRLRFKDLGLSAGQWAEAETPVPLRRAGAERALVPVATMVLLFMMVMLTAPQMMSAVIEEKMSRISEVLLSSVTPFDLMLGKLLACSGASVLVGALYLAGLLGLARYFGYGDMAGPGAIAVFFFFLILAVFLHGSLYMAVGAACAQPKDAQGSLAPLVLLTAVPLLTLRSLLEEPSGSLARGLSYFPLSAPFVMGFRLNGQPRPVVSELVLSVALTLLATLFSVWAASRVFRIGLLAQGKAPGLVQLFRWIFIG